MNRARMHVTGQVQGVGFRPFVLRLATSLDLTGYVLNSPAGVVIEAEGLATALALFSQRLRAQAPAAARIERIDSEDCVVLGGRGFEIRCSVEGSAQVGLVPDLAVCAACIAELRDPDDRRHRYPFVTCAQCGPRFSMAFALPYDRQRTSMRDFPLCQACRQEYEDPNDRRCHAQGISCAACGPRLSACDGQGRELAYGDAALQRATAVLDSGGIVALKGLTGFQLLVAADQDAAVARLRARKNRPAKPLAVLVRSVAEVSRWATLDRIAERELTAPEGPVVLLPAKVRAEPGISAAVSGGSPLLGVLLPTTPLHQLLRDARAAPLVVTSGNRSSEPLCRDNAQALERLREVADLWLMHDREIVRAMDDSVLRIAAGRRCLLRRARGFVPRLLHSAEALPDTLALGGHGKNTVAISHGHAVFVSEHLGDLDTQLNRASHVETARALPALLAATPQCIVTDLHPDYATHAPADELCATWSAPRAAVQHHLAHVLAVAAEHELRSAVLGVAWDGSGLGSDGRIWGGEFFRVDMANRRARRIAHLRPFALIGGERAAREPRRIAIALLHETFGPDWRDHELCRAPLAHFDCPPETLRNLAQLARTGATSVLCTSVGRLFDAVSSLLGLCQLARYEAEAALALEGAALSAASARERWHDSDALAAVAGFMPADRQPCEIDWRPWLRYLLGQQLAGVAAAQLALHFHLWLARSIVDVAVWAGLDACVLSGGCFQNACLIEVCREALAQRGHRVYCAEALPANDGGLAFGQLHAAARGIELA